MDVDVVIDPICPWCFIGKRRFERAVAARPGLDIRRSYRAYQLNPDMPQEGMDRRDYLRLKFGGLRLADHLYENIRRAGIEEGIDFQFEKIERTPNTLNAHRLIRWARTLDLQSEISEELFRRYFLAGEDIGRQDVLVDAARSVGMDWRLVAELLGTDSDRDTVMAEDRMARQMGVRGVPFYIVEHAYAITGVEEFPVFLQVFDVAQEKAASMAASSAAV